MNKKLIRLTESDLHRIVKESVKRVLKESKPRLLREMDDYQRIPFYGLKRYLEKIGFEMTGKGRFDSNDGYTFTFEKTIFTDENEIFVEIVAYPRGDGSRNIYSVAVNYENVEGQSYHMIMGDQEPTELYTLEDLKAFLEEKGLDNWGYG